MPQTITRTAFLAAIEKGIAEAHGLPAPTRPAHAVPVAVALPRNWRAKLREVGKTAQTTTVGLFDACPITLAGLQDFPMDDERAWAFIDGFDRAVRARRPRFHADTFRVID